MLPRDSNQRRKKPVTIKPSYKPLEITLIRRDRTRNDLRYELGISPSTLAKMTHGEYVALDVIGVICEYLHCNIGDVVEFVPVKKDRP